MAEMTYIHGGIVYLVKVGIWDVVLRREDGKPMPQDVPSKCIRTRWEQMVASDGFEFIPEPDVPKARRYRDTHDGILVTAIYVSHGQVVIAIRADGSPTSPRESPRDNIEGTAHWEVLVAVGVYEYIEDVVGMSDEWVVKGLAEWKLFLQRNETSRRGVASRRSYL